MVDEREREGGGERGVEKWGGSRMGGRKSGGSVGGSVEEVWEEECLVLEWWREM